MSSKYRALLSAFLRLSPDAGAQLRAKSLERQGVGQLMRLVLVHGWVIIIVLVPSAPGRGSTNGIRRGAVSMSD